MDDLLTEARRAIADLQGAVATCERMDRARARIERRVAHVAIDLWDSYVLQARESNEIDRRNELSRAGRLGSWRRWKRDKQILAMLPVVDRIAKQVRWMFALYIDVRDLAQAGTVGLVNAANCYDPASAGRGGFEAYAWFRVRGAIIDSQKRKVYREELNVSLQAIRDAHDGWLPPRLDTDRAELQDEAIERDEIHRVLWAAIADLPPLERQALEAHLAGESLAVTAKGMGRSLAATRATLADARERVGAVVRGAVA